MTIRGKFLSLTMINWNGFFARTFELDELVTTLSGGNGAGKSTTMAAFVTALIPDLTLLHFRNTTEAGATSGSRDKGLHGKLKPGVCYAVLDVLNSRNQRLFCGVRLQQIAGRDKKVDIKPFILQNISNDIYPSQLFTQPINDKQVKVVSLNELKTQLDSQTIIEFRQFNSITEYHAQLFDLGILSKRLRSGSDRSKFYRLLEASLYGGISSAITRSLREYLLPENRGVRKAFQDMELALKENRMTLNMLKLTQRDRDLFKHLIHESTLYVAADYVRYRNERRQQVGLVWKERQDMLQERQQLRDKQHQLISLSQQLTELSEEQEQLQQSYQNALINLNQVQGALKQQDKIERYRQDLDELQYRLEEQTAILEESQENYTQWQDKEQQVELELDELRAQLADSQQALDVQQTHKTQYVQAEQALSKVQQLCQLPELTVVAVEQELIQRQQQEEHLTTQLLEMQQKLTLSQGTQQQFDQAFNLVQQLTQQTVSATTAWQCAKEFLAQWPAQCYLASRQAALEKTCHELYIQHQGLQEAQQLLEKLRKKIVEPFDIKELAIIQQQKLAQQEELMSQLQENNELHRQLQLQQHELTQQQANYAKRIPQWVHAQEALSQLVTRYQHPLTTQEAVTHALQQLVEQQREYIFEREKIKQQRDRLETQIEQLNQPSGANDERLLPIAEKLGGALLSEVYEDISIEDAAYFSALYGPVRDAIVVPDLTQVREALVGLEDVPTDLYLIEGDPQSFDDSLFNSEELFNAVLIKSSDRQWRYSRFPTMPLFGRAARERYRDELLLERNVLAERYATLSFDVQKLQRLHEQFGDFIGQHLAVAFEIDPAAKYDQCSKQLIELERDLLRLTEQLPHYQQTLVDVKAINLLINSLFPVQHLLLQQATIETQYQEITQQLTQAQQATQFVSRHQTQVQQLESTIDILRTPPTELADLTAGYTLLTQQQQRLKQEIFLLSDVWQRRQHFSYSYTLDETASDEMLSERLRMQLEETGQQRDEIKAQVAQLQQQHRDITELHISLKSAYQAKDEMYHELLQEQITFEQILDSNLLHQATQQTEKFEQRLQQNRQLCLHQEKRISLLEHDLESSQKLNKKGDRDYLQRRKQTVLNKINWCRVIRLVRQHTLEKRLYRRDLAHLSREELRSISDKALGALRLAVVDNEHLRDILRYSEDLSFPEKKIEFYIAIYQHLKERIRQDIMKTDDPIEAIEQMEIELARLEEELSLREKTLAISAKSVANIIRKIIQREQGRIRFLNQGLQLVAFGQVKGVRINAMIRESHDILLNALTNAQEQHADLFTSAQLTFSEALAKLYQRLNPQIELGQRTPQTVGEELLDYRNYMELDVEVSRGNEGWLRAESGALSTGEAIGTGMSILLMVIQSWEEESKRLRGKDVLPCRLLFLDEAARLDAKSIETLFELCDRLAMQLIIAAPENISPDKGTTYKLVRKILNKQEYVHVVGLKGFALSSH